MVTTSIYLVPTMGKALFKGGAGMISFNPDNNPK